CDPAIGSGAFPVGMMHEIVNARNVLTTYLENKSDRDTYTLKRHCIQESLYGVDIDPGAIDIAKLRLWLSLIVDEEDYHSINPLPNLDYKIMQGNSLIEEFHGISLDLGKSDNGDLLGIDPELESLIEALHSKQNALFNARHPGEKKRLKDKVEDAIMSIFHYELEKRIAPYRKELEEIEKTANRPGIIREQYLQEERQKLQKRYGIDPEAIENELREMTHGNKLRNFFPWRLYFANVFRKKGGFDVVIANPPYGLKVSTGIRDLYFPSNNDGKQSKDSYSIFLAQGLQILRKEGHLCFITSDTWQTIKSHKPLRRLLLDNSRIRHVLAMPGWVFGATVNTSILSLEYLPGEVFRQEREKNELWACDFTRLPNRDDKILSQVLAYWDSQGISLGESKYRIVEAPKVPEDFERDIPIARYRYPQKLIPLFFNIPFFIGSFKLYRLMNDTTVPIVKKEIGKLKTIGAKVRQVNFNGNALELVRLGDIAEVKVGLQTGDNKYYLRKAPGARGSYEIIDYSKVLTGEEIRNLAEDEKRNGVDPDKYSGRHFLPYDKGEESDAEEGWLPNYWVPASYFIDWSKDAVHRLKTLTVADRKRFYGEEDKIELEDETTIASRFQNRKYYFRSGITFSRTGVYAPTFRVNTSSVFDTKSNCLFCSIYTTKYLLAILNSLVLRFLFKAFLCHTVQAEGEALREIPLPFPSSAAVVPRLEELVEGIVRKQKLDLRYPYYLHEQLEIDRLVYDLYGLSDNDIAEIEAWYARRYPKLAQAQPNAEEREEV
ncbi:N-6 DNA methylase, partial [Candidatus Bipolaricaulota bacterium]|nr:N-6 DNA methylase [Candidatus Bipolaricaulota bacterium]